MPFPSIVVMLMLAVESPRDIFFGQWRLGEIERREAYDEMKRGKTVNLREAIKNW